MVLHLLHPYIPLGFFCYKVIYTLLQRLSFVVFWALALHCSHITLSPLPLLLGSFLGFLKVFWRHSFVLSKRLAFKSTYSVEIIISKELLLRIIATAQCSTKEIICISCNCIFAAICHTSMKCGPYSNITNWTHFGNSEKCRLAYIICIICAAVTEFCGNIPHFHEIPFWNVSTQAKSELVF